MKVITEASLRAQFHGRELAEYILPTGAMLSPSAREYLQGRKIKIIREQEAVADMNNYAEFRYIDYESGAYFRDKPEHMTQLRGSFLVAKSHPRIIMRGRLDSLCSLLILKQCQLQAAGAGAKLLADLSDIARVLAEIMRSEVLDESYVCAGIIGYSLEELHARSHDPQKFFGIKQMQAPRFEMGFAYAQLNHLRAEIRELELCAHVAFCEQKEEKSDLLRELNRLSSALHVMMCKQLADEYS